MRLAVFSEVPLSGYILAHARSSHGRGPVPGQSMWRRVGGLVYIPAAAIAALSTALRTAGEGMVSQQRNGYVTMTVWFTSHAFFVSV